MANERKWTYEGPASPRDANGQTCIFCGKALVDEAQPARWVVKVDEDYADADFPTEVGYSHHACAQAHGAEQRKSRFSLPEVPDLPKR